MHAKTSDSSIADNSSELQAELAVRSIQIAPTDGLHLSAIPGLTVARRNMPSAILPALYEPSLCIVVQGAKRAMLGQDIYVYDALHYLVVSVTLAMKSQITTATPDRPYLCLRLTLDRKLISELLLQSGPAAVAKPADDRGLFVARTSPPLLDAVLRLLRLLDEPRHAAVLAPLAIREIHYRVLVGEWGYRLRELCAENGLAQRIDSAIQMLVKHYAEPLSIEDLAEVAHMSVSSLHHRFKAVTAMSPMQFQKQLRLQEARRLMLSEGLEAAAAAFRVGYESASQFSREYRRQFGAPPRRDIDIVRFSA